MTTYVTKQKQKKAFNGYIRNIHCYDFEDVKSDRPVDIAIGNRKNFEPNGAGPLRDLQEHSRTEF